MFQTVAIAGCENLIAMVHLEDHGHSFWSVSLSIAVGFSFHGALETSLPQGGLKVIFGSLSQASTLTLSKNKMVAIIIIIKPLFKEGGT